MVDIAVQRSDSYFRSVLVDESQSNAQDHDGRDDSTVGGVAGRGRDCRGTKQQDQQRITELPEKDPERSHSVLSQHVGAERCSSDLGLFGGETLLGGSQASDHLGCWLTGGRLEIKR